MKLEILHHKQRWRSQDKSAAALGTEQKHWFSLQTDGFCFAVPGNLVPELQAQDS